MQKQIWIGPFRDASEFGELVRGHVRALLSAGVTVDGVDSRGPGRYPLPDSEFPPILDGAITYAGAQIVLAGSCTELPLLARSFGIPVGSGYVAFVPDVVEAPDDEAIAILSSAGAVWVISTLSREILAMSGVDRRKIQVMPPAIDTTLFRAGMRAPHTKVRFVALANQDVTALARIVRAYLATFDDRCDVELVLAAEDTTPASEISAALVRELCDEVDFFASNRPRITFDTSMFTRTRRALRLLDFDVFIASDSTSALGLHALEALAMGLSVIAVDAGVATEFLHQGTALLVPGLVAPGGTISGAANYDHSALGSALRVAVTELETRQRLARRGAEEVAHGCTETLAAQTLLGHRETPWTARHEVLSRFLWRLGLSRPEDLLPGSRSKVLVYSFSLGESSWSEPLRSFAQSTPAHADQNLCLWADSDHKEGLDQLSAAVSAAVEELLQTSQFPDVYLMVAPIDHLPPNAVLIDSQLKELTPKRDPMPTRTEVPTEGSACALLSPTTA